MTWWERICRVGLVRGPVGSSPDVLGELRSEWDPSLLTCQGACSLAVSGKVFVLGASDRNGLGCHCFAVATWKKNLLKGNNSYEPGPWTKQIRGKKGLSEDPDKTLIGENHLHYGRGFVFFFSFVILLKRKTVVVKLIWTSWASCPHFGPPWQPNERSGAEKTTHLSFHFWESTYRKVYEAGFNRRSRTSRRYILRYLLQRTGLQDLVSSNSSSYQETLRHTLKPLSTGRISSSQGKHQLCS